MFELTQDELSVAQDITKLIEPQLGSAGRNSDGSPSPRLDTKFAVGYILGVVAAAHASSGSQKRDAAFAFIAKAVVSSLFQGAGSTLIARHTTGPFGLREDEVLKGMLLGEAEFHTWAYSRRAMPPKGLHLWTCNV